MSQNITASELEEYCVENNIELLHSRQISKPEAHLKAFHRVFKFDEEKVELPDFWPENVTVSKCLNVAARDWLKKLDQNGLLASPQLIQRTKPRSAELNHCLHYVRSVSNDAKDVNALLEVFEIGFGVFIESQITNNSGNDFILKKCCPQDSFL